MDFHLQYKIRLNSILGIPLICKKHTKFFRPLYVITFAKIPNVIPIIFPKEENLPLYILFDCGINSHDTIYNIAPAANASDTPINCLEIFPIIAPQNAPIPVVTPDNAVNKTALNFPHPLLFIGNAIDIPSGTSCIAIAIAKDNPRDVEAPKPEPIANPFWKIMYC